MAQYDNHSAIWWCVATNNLIYSVHVHQFIDLSSEKLQASNCFCLYQGICFHFLTVDFRLSFKPLSFAL